MIHLLLTLFLVVSFLQAQESVDKKISKTTSKISSFSKNYSNINKKMAKNAKAILKQKKELQKQNVYLDELEKELKEKEGVYEDNTSQLAHLKKYQGTLKSEQKALEEELLSVIGQSVSLSVILDTEYAENIESLIEFEILKSMLEQSKAKANHLNKQFFTNAKNIDELKGHTDSLEVAISTIDKKRKDLINTKKENKKALKKLELSKNTYKTQLQELLKKQNELKRTLAKLNIIKVDNRRKEKEEKERREAFARKSIVSNDNLPKVKKHGSSYQSVKTKKYRGSKTIAPLDRYSITKKYGTYTDPIYGIKIFNESISLKPKKSNAKVKTVFNGKVIYADKTAVLDNLLLLSMQVACTLYMQISLKFRQILKKVKRLKKVIQLVE